MSVELQAMLRVLRKDFKLADKTDLQLLSLICAVLRMTGQKNSTAPPAAAVKK